MRLLSLALVVLALCGPATALGSTKAPNPCVVITASAAATVLKATPAAAKPKSTASWRTCTYTVKRMSLIIETRNIATVSAFNASTKALPAPVFPVSGVTDAYSADGGQELALWKNGAEVIVKFVGLDPVVQVQATLASAAFAGL